MVQINFALREVNVKVVYYGPGRSGKTTNLEMIHSKAPKGSIGDMMSIATETDRTLFFDFMPLDLGKVAGMTTKFLLYTVPGQVYYKATRKLVLQGADGVVFVADSQKEMLEENLQSLQDLEENLAENGLDINTIPFILQWNKRDLDNIMSVDELNSKLNRWNVPHFEAKAIAGDGVFPTLKALAKVIIGKLNKEHGYAGDASSEMPAVKQTTDAIPQGAVPATPTQAMKKEAAQVLAAELGGTPPPEAPPVAPPPPPVPPAASAPPPPPVVPVPHPPAAPLPVPTTPAPPIMPSPVSTPAAPPVAPAPAVPPVPPTAKVAPPVPSPTSAKGVADDGDAISREMQKRREAAARKKQEQLDRVKKGSKKPIQKQGIPVVPIVIGAVILVAIAIIIVVVMKGS